MHIDILDLQRIVKIDKKETKKLTEGILENLGEGDKTELSLLFVDDFYIKRLNNKYRGVNSKTDVLAFPMREAQGLLKNNHILGDVVVSAQTAKREAGKRKTLVEKELALYLVHGILHLLGYDDRTSVQRKRMKSKEEELLGIL